MTTILCIRKNNEVVMAGDGQATLGETVIFKSKSVKVRRIGNGKIIAGTRAKKVHSKSFNAFDSINLPTALR